MRLESYMEYIYERKDIVDLLKEEIERENRMCIYDFANREIHESNILAIRNKIFLLSIFEENE